jgi:HPt (histidine-containing phosphotransfer) domain-containing protein
MSQSTAIAGVLRSSLADDPDLFELVELYVDEMPQRIELLLGHFAAADWSGLAALAHQLKGAAGSHGFHQLTTPAAELERATRQQKTEAEILAALDQLVKLCRRVGR